MTPTRPQKTLVPGNRFWAATKRPILLAAAIGLAFTLVASDHADPIDPFGRERLEGGITDLFVFPVDANGKSICRFDRRDSIPLQHPNVKPRTMLMKERQAEIKSIVVILCVHRALTQTGSLILDPYTYKIHMDLRSTVSIDDDKEDMASDHPATGQGGGYQPPAGARKSLTVQEARARYGGLVANPETITSSVEIEMNLNNDATWKQFRVTGLRSSTDISKHDKKAKEISKDPKKIIAWADVHDDPFIFPAFFGTNVVAMVVSIPIGCFPENQMDKSWLIWGTSHQGSRQIDHVGRSLRTQNPRFEMLNTVHPSKHVDSIEKAEKNRTLKRDLALRFNLQSLFAYRYWDFVPDVMIYTPRYPAGFPNGRLLEDDVAAMLAQLGDTLLLELSYQHPKGGWPRQTENDKKFGESFPYLAPPWPDSAPLPQNPSLTGASQAKLAGIAIAVLIFLALFALVVSRVYYRKQLRRRYL